MRFLVLGLPIALLMAHPLAAQSCDKNYTGACVPVAKDVDCAGGSGNGPKYVKGPVKVVGQDIYKLDSNNNGYGCEPSGWTPSHGLTGS